MRVYIYIVNSNELFEKILLIFKCLSFSFSLQPNHHKNRFATDIRNLNVYRYAKNIIYSCRSDTVKYALLRMHIKRS